MRKFRCTVTRTDEYEIELDETILDEEWMEAYKDFFADYDSLEEHAENVAQMRSRFGTAFIEGYGNVLVDGMKPWGVNDDAVNKGVNIKIVDEDYQCEVEVEEI